MPESIGGSVMHDVQTLSAGQMLQKRGERVKNARSFNAAACFSPRVIFFQEFPSKMGKKALLCRICGGEFCG